MKKVFVLISFRERDEYAGDEVTDSVVEGVFSTRELAEEQGQRLPYAVQVFEFEIDKTPDA